MKEYSIVKTDSYNNYTNIKYNWINNMVLTIEKDYNNIHTSYIIRQNDKNGDVQPGDSLIEIILLSNNDIVIFNYGDVQSIIVIKYLGK